MNEEERVKNENSNEERFVFELKLDETWDSLTLEEKAQKVSQIRQSMMKDQ